MSSNSPLLDLFYADAETHMGVLTEGILALEKDPTQAGRYESLMRAAHSIKGAARIVGLDHAVSVAHVIEDCFVAARQGHVQIGSTVVDVLLPAIDMLQRVTQAGAATAAPSSAEVQAVVQRVRDVMSGRATESAKPVAVSTVPATSPGVPAAAVEFQVGPHFDRTWALAHLAAVSDGLDSRPQAMRFDLTATQQIDPVAIGLLVIVAKLAARGPQSPRLELANCSPALSRLFQVTGLARKYHVTSGEA